MSRSNFHRIRTIFAAPDTMEAIHRVFRYIFSDEERESSVPQLDTHTLNGEPLSPKRVM